MTQDNGMPKNVTTIEVLNQLAQECYTASSQSGFHAAHQLITEMLDEPGSCSVIERARRWFEATVHQAEIARMHSELSEGLESIRKNPIRLDEHLPEFDNVTVEYADCIIRILDTCGKRGLPIGEALVAKMQYNASRPYLHKKNS